MKKRSTRLQVVLDLAERKRKQADQWLSQSQAKVQQGEATLAQYPALIATDQAGLNDGEIYITFDDGYADNLDIVENFLKPQGIKPIVFVVTGLLDGEIENRTLAGLKKIPCFSFDFLVFKC